jgi:hypothetical protein
VYELNKAGGAPVLVAPAQSAPTAVGVDATSVYWTNATGSSSSSSSSSGGPSGNALLKAPLAGGSQTQLAQIMAVGGGSTSLAVDGIAVYWMAGDGNVTKVPVGGGAPVVLGTGTGGTGRVAVDATSVYWTVGVWGTVMKAAK